MSKTPHPRTVRRSPSHRRALSRALLVWTALIALVCCASPDTTAQPRGKAVKRTLDRNGSSGEGSIDGSLFRPVFLETNTPQPLQEAYTAFQRGDTKRAHDVLTVWLSASKGHALEARASFLLAVVQRKRGEHADAAARFEAAAKALPLLADYAHYKGARSAFEAEDYAATVRMCKAIGMSSRFGPRSKYLRGQALLRTKAFDDAIEVFEQLLEASPRASFASDVKLDLASAYEVTKRPEDAAPIYLAMKMRHPGGGIEKRADNGIKRLRKTLSKAKAKTLLTPSVQDRVLRGRALYDRHRSKRVVSDMTALMKEAKPKKGSKTWCDITWLLARSQTKLRDHKAAAAHYVPFIDACSDDKRVIKGLYAAGRGLWTVDQDEAALKLFKRLWDEHPTHSYADDAVLYAARIHRSNANEKKYQELLDFQVKTFPQGDMIADAHWHRFLTLYSAKKYVKAAQYVETVGKDTGEKDLYTRGRLAYFRARALEQSGATKRALDAFVQVARDVPMSYYALLALNRIKALDEARFKGEMERLATASPNAKGLALDPPELAEDTGFKRGVELLRMGMFSEARAEFGALQRRYPSGEGLLWTTTFLFDRAGAYHLSHNIPRRQISSFGTSYPTGDQLDRYLLAYPKPFFEPLTEWTKKRKIPLALAYAIMREESGFNPQIESWANACGLMQLMVPTAKNMGKLDGMKGAKKLTCSKLFKPETNIRLGTRFLQVLHEAYGGHLSVAIAGYNGGQGNVNRWLRARGEQPFDLWVEEIPFGQTRGYTKRVTQSLWIYQWLYGHPSPKPEERLIELPLKLPPPSK